MDYAAVRDGLRRLAEASPPPKVFGAEAHRFRPHPPVPEPEVAAFEARHRVVLPTDYRGFLTHVGNGGAGPAYGLFPLGTDGDTGGDPDPWAEGGGFVGVLSEPFPHTRPWNDLAGRPEYEEEWDDDENLQDEYNRRLSAWEAGYFRTANVNGAVPVCHLGCAKRLWLVVTGPEAGRIWADDRADHLGLRPEGLSFRQWYEQWLGGALRRIGRA